VKRTPIRFRSDKRTAQQDYRRKLAEQWQGERCWIGLVGVCEGYGWCWHELVGAGVGGSRVDPRNLCWSCGSCNTTLERLDDRYEQGLKVRSSDAEPGDGGLVPREAHRLALAGRWT
jgi:hypothetical protein